MAKKCPECYRYELVESRPSSDGFTCAHCGEQFFLEELMDG